jgi:hypothetical protein
MKNSIVLSLFAVATLFGSAAVRAQSTEDGSCARGIYYEEYLSSNETWDFDVPYLANGESVTVDHGTWVYNVWTGGTYYPVGQGGGGAPLTFTCNYGYISGGSSYGFWQYY